MSLLADIRSAQRQVRLQSSGTTREVGQRLQKVRDIFEAEQRSSLASAHDDGRGRADSVKRQEVVHTLRELADALECASVFPCVERNLENALSALRAAARFERNPEGAELDPGGPRFMERYREQQSALRFASWISDVAAALDVYPDARVPKMHAISLQMVQAHHLGAYCGHLAAALSGQIPVSALLGEDPKIFKNHSSLIGLRLPSILTRSAEMMERHEAPGSMKAANKLRRAAQKIETRRSPQAVDLHALAMEMPETNPVADMLFELADAQTWVDTGERISKNATSSMSI